MTVDLRVIRNDASIRARRRTSQSIRVLPTIVQPIVEPLETVVARSIDELDRRQWDSLFLTELEDWRYLRTLERSRLEGCEPVYFGIRSRGRLVAAVPAFVGRLALTEPWRARSRSQWRRASERSLVLGSPFAAACRIGFTPRATPEEQVLLLDRLLRAARDESARRGLDGFELSCDDAVLGGVYQQRGESMALERTPGAAMARLQLPRWSFADYLSCFDEALRGQLLGVCAQAGQYERDSRVDLARDLEPMLSLCREAGLDEIGKGFFKEMLGSDPRRMACLLVRDRDGGLAGFSIALHDAHALVEKLTVVSRREKAALVRGMLWLETLRFCLQHGLAVYESASALALSAARPSELRQSWRWVATAEAAAAPAAQSQADARSPRNGRLGPSQR